jgi:cell division protein FtsI/penicillin-binding protein 2
MTIRQIISLLNKEYKNILLLLRKNNPELYQFTQKKEWAIVVFFAVLLFILLLRLFVLQIVDFKEFDKKLTSNHSTSTRLEAKR